MIELIVCLAAALLIPACQEDKKKSKKLDKPLTKKSAFDYDSYLKTLHGSRIGFNASTSGYDPVRQVFWRREDTWDVTEF